MERLTFTAQLRSPIIMNGYLTLDALLGALLFERLGDPDAAHDAIPIRRTEGLFHASAAILAPDERGEMSIAASLRAQHDLSPDLFEKNQSGTKLRRKLGQTRRRDYGNVLSSYPTLSASEVRWHCEGDPDAIAALLAGADFIGKKRASGYGEVAGWDMEAGDLDGLVDRKASPCGRSRSIFLQVTRAFRWSTRHGSPPTGSRRTGPPAMRRRLSIDAHPQHVRDDSARLRAACPAERPHQRPRPRRGQGADDEPRLRKGTSSRLTGWAIFRQDGATLQADLDLPAGSGVAAGDGRTRFEAFADELEALPGPVVLLTFTKSTVNLSSVFATYDTRMVRVCSPVSVETFDFTQEPGRDAGVAFRNMHKARLKRAKEGEVAGVTA